MRHLFTTRALVALVGLAMVAGSAVTYGATLAMAPRPVVTEDDPGWDCATMGNRVCGSDPVDLSDPFTRCLEAVEAAHIPGWMWECHEHPPVVSTLG